MAGMGMVATTRREKVTQLLRVGQVAVAMNVHPNTVRRWAEQGLLTMHRIGPRGDRRFLRSEVDRLLNSALTRRRHVAGR